MASSISGLIEAWGTFYGDHAALQSGVTFAHIGGLLVSGGLALTTDRAVLRTRRDDHATRRLQLQAMRDSHTLVVSGLGLVFASGILLLLADLESLLGSVVFWTKMGLVALMLLNGLVMLRIEGTVERDPASDLRWTQLRRVCGISLALWLLTTLAGATLLNAG